MGKNEDPNLLQISGGLPPNFSYAKHYPVLALLDPNSLNANTDNELLIRVYSSKQPRSGIRNAPIGLALYKDARFYYISTVTFDVIIPVGIAFLLAIFSLLIYRLTKKARASRPIIVAFSQMCMAFTIYLVFVSNLPREFLAPWLTVHLHCLFRFLADWTFFDVTWKAFSLKSNRIKKGFNLIYGGVVALVSLSTVIQLFAPEAQQETLGTAIPYMISGKLFFMAFAPMILGIVASFISKAHERPKVWTFFYFLLLYFQVNDTLVFLEVFEGIYYVRFYPLLIAIFLGLEVFERYRRETERKKIDEAKMQAAWDTANQVVHDIQSPLSAYRTALDVAKDDLSEESRVLFRAIYARLTGITTSLSQQMRGQTTLKMDSRNRLSTQSIPSLLDSLIAEKRLEYQDYLNINLSFDLDESAYGIFAKVAPDDFKRGISNLINNAIEATDSGTIAVSLQKRNGLCEILVEDNGRGMSADILDQLGNKGFSHAKKKGSGLGFYFAKSKIEEWRGKVKVDSTPERGTEVRIELPLVEAPKWFLRGLELTGKETIVILDDDPSIHSSWKNKLRTTKVKGVRHFTSPERLRSWVSANDSELIRYFIDYEFLNSKENGIQLLEEVSQIQMRSTLVTSRSEELKIQRAVKTLGIKLLPKSMVSYVPVRLLDESKAIDAVLLDDDPMVRETWKHSAIRYKKKILTFADRSELLNSLDRVAFDTNIYLDLNLDGDSGKDVAVFLRRRGFKNLFISTGSQVLDEDRVSFVRGVVSKSPPWIAC